MKLNLSKLSLFQKYIGMLLLVVIAVACSKMDEIPLELNKVSKINEKDSNSII